MKKPILVFLMFFVVAAKAQPVSLRTDVLVDSLMAIQPYAVKIDYDSATTSLHYITFSGNVYQIIEEPGQPLRDTLIADENLHGINYLQGFVFKDSMLFVCGNHKSPSVPGYGIVACGVLQPDGSRMWHNVVTTSIYPSSAVLYDHAFSSIIVNAAGDSLIFASGARTDHGEIESTNGLYPNTRDVPLTTKLFTVPITAQNLCLPNDENALDSMGVIFAHGVRNTFDMAYDKDDQLFGVENSGDRDDPEEINWLRQNHHYGFPWQMGGHVTPMQFIGYDATLDLLINHNSLAWGNNCFYNDSTYPIMPASLNITQPVRNFGPDADKYRDELTGNVMDASDNGTFLTTFTSHRSPLGIMFDRYSKLGDNLTGDGFVMSYTKGTMDSTGTLPDNTTGPFVDLGEDLLHLQMSYNTAQDNYDITATKIVTNFASPVDACLVGHVMYTLEIGINAPSIIRVLTFPPNTSGIKNNSIEITTKIFPNPSSDKFYLQLNAPFSKDTFSVSIRHISGKQTPQTNFKQISESMLLVNCSHLKPGMYVVKVTKGNLSENLKLIIH